MGDMSLRWPRRLGLVAGDWVEVRSAEEILSTLDQRGRLDNLPFQPEMLLFCGQRLQVSKVAHKTCDNAQTLNTGLAVIEGIYGRDGDGFGVGTDYLTNILTVRVTDATGSVGASPGVIVIVTISFIRMRDCLMQTHSFGVFDFIVHGAGTTYAVLGRIVEMRRHVVIFRIPVPVPIRHSTNFGGDQLTAKKFNSR
ncbi:MAG: hypothetical protein HC793_00445 [Aquincola sp.]|nr:hypothetical protein [Aquincola sp.]